MMTFLCRTYPVAMCTSCLNLLVAFLNLHARGRGSHRIARQAGQAADVPGAARRPRLVFLVSVCLSVHVYSRTSVCGLTPH